ERALDRWLVLAPAQNLCPVADPPAARVVVGDLDDEFRPQPDPLHFLLGLPPRRVAVSTVPGLVRPELGQQALLLRRRDPRGVPDDVELAVVVVEPQDQRADGPGLLARTVAGD